MKKLVISVVLLAAAVSLIAEPFSGQLISNNNGGNRSVLIVDQATGNFEVYELDATGYDRKNDFEYYPVIKYNRAAQTREIIMIRK